VKTVRAYVKNLFIKPERQASMSDASCLDLLAGFGIRGNINSDEMSPRQILVICQEDLQRLAISPGELRENIVLALDDVQLLKPGAKLSFPSGAEVRLTFYCEPCKRMANLVDSIASLEQKRGILGVAIASGAIALKDRVTIEPNYFPPLSEIPYERFLSYVELIPTGKVVTYKQVIKCIGVDRSYFRAIPVYLKKAPANYPLHRVLDSQGRITPHVLHQREKLAVEGIEVIERYGDRSVCLKKYIWKHSTIY